MLTLCEIPIGQQVRMLDFHSTIMPMYRHKLLAMGFTPGVLVKVLCVAPLGDPIQVHLRGYTLSLRKSECCQIEVEYINADQAKRKKLLLATASCAHGCACRESKLRKNHDF